jgi:hypothetical protein
MQKTGNNIRLNFGSLLAGMLLLLALILTNMSSTGIIRGDDDDNEGSGIGGTGRLLTPGSESGLGGTGFKPFIGLNEARGIQILNSPELRELAVSDTVALNIEPEQPVDSKPIASLIAVSSVGSFTTDSSAINISEQIQRTVDSNVLALEQLRISLEPVVPDQLIETILAGKTELGDNLVVGHNPPLIENDDSNLSTQQQPSWEALARYLTSNSSQSSSDDDASQMATQLTIPDYEYEAEVRQARPERIHRPQLPPVQRARPIQRSAILPPRIKPLRL